MLAARNDSYDPQAPPWRDTSRSPAERAAALLANLTIEEKVGQLGSTWDQGSAGDFAPSVEGADAHEPGADAEAVPGLGQITRPYGTAPVSLEAGSASLLTRQHQVGAGNRWGIPALVHEECLTGVAILGATAYPTPLAWAAAFDPDLVRQMAEAIGADMRALGVHQGLAPVVDVVRDYRWGRVEETLGEDPYLVSQLAVAYVSGLESAGVIATLKHFAGYASSRAAKNHAPVSIGSRELADIVLPPFEAAVRLGGARSVMNAYNDLDGVPGAANRELLVDLLRGCWGFDGTVVSDYWAVPFLASTHHVVKDAARAGAMALSAGIDVELPTTVGFGADLVAGVRSGTVPEADLDRAVLAHLRQKVEAGLLDGSEPVPASAASVDLDSPRNRALARLLAQESVVLLDNGRQLLPLAPGARLAIIGPNAVAARHLLGSYSFPNHVLPSYPQHGLGLPMQTIADALGAAHDGEVRVAEGCQARGGDRSGLSEAVAVAEDADIAVVVVGDVAGLFGKGTCGEGCDVTDLRLPGVQHELVDAVLETGTPTVVVVVSGRPYALGFAAGRAAALVQAFLPGVEGAAALANVLTGVAVPTGRLPVQIPRDPGATGTYLVAPLSWHEPGVSVLDPRPLFPFGHGLGYSVVEYGPVICGKRAVPTDGAVQLDVALTNRGSREAVEVVQVYAADLEAQVVRPRRQLVAFARVALAPGSVRTVRFVIDTDLLSFTGRDLRRIVEPGQVRFAVGRDSDDQSHLVDVELVGPLRELSGAREMFAAVTLDPVDSGQGSERVADAGRAPSGTSPDSEPSFGSA